MIRTLALSISLAVAASSPTVAATLRVPAGRPAIPLGIDAGQRAFEVNGGTLTHSAGRHAGPAPDLGAFETRRP